MFRFDIKTFETFENSQRKTVKTLEVDEGQETNQDKNDQNEERTDYEGKLGSGIHPPLHKGSTTATQYT